MRAAAAATTVDVLIRLVGTAQRGEPHMSEQSQIARLGLAALGLVVVAAAMWFAWLGWDHEYYLVDGVAQGRYRAWQVIRCGVAIVVATLSAYLWAPWRSAIAVLWGAAAVGFAVPWSYDSSGDGPRL